MTQIIIEIKHACSFYGGSNENEWAKLIEF